MSDAVFLPGDRVDLRPIEREDLEFLQAAINDPAVRRNLTVRWPLNYDQEEEWFEEQVTSEENINLLIVGEDGPAGAIGLGPIDNQNGTAELGIWLQAADQGNGYGTEASTLLLDHAFDELRLHRIEARVFEGNDASLRSQLPVPALPAALGAFGVACVTPHADFGPEEAVLDGEVLCHTPPYCEEG